MKSPNMFNNWTSAARILATTFKSFTSVQEKHIILDMFA